MGNFNLEDGVNNVLTCLGEGCDYNLDEIEEFNQNMENLIQANSINRGQNNIVLGASQPVAS